MIFCEAHFCSWYRFTITIALKMFCETGPRFKDAVGTVHFLPSLQRTTTITCLMKSDRVWPKTLKWVVVFSSVTFHINGQWLFSFATFWRWERERERENHSLSGLSDFQAALSNSYSNAIESTKQRGSLYRFKMTRPGR